MPTPRHLAPRKVRAACIALAALGIAHGTAAQNVGSAEQINGALLQQIEALEARIKDLEERLENPLTVKAPFVVTDETGEPLLAVARSSGGGSLLHVTAPGTSAIAALEVSPEAARVGVKSTGGDTAKLESNPGAGGTVLQVTDSGGETAQLGVLNGKSSFRMWTAGEPYLDVGAAGGRRLAFGDSAAPAFELTDDADVARVGLRKGSSTILLSASADRATLDVGGPGNGRAEIESTQAATRVSVRGAGDAAGADSVALAMNQDGPNLELLRGGTPRAILGTPDGAHPALRIYDSSGGLALSAGLGAAEAEAVGIALWRGDREVAILGDNKKYPGEGLLQLVRGGELLVEIGRSYGAEPGLRVFDEGALPAIEASVDSAGVPVVSIAQGGKVAASMAIDDGVGSFDVIRGDESVASLNAKGDGGGLVLRDGSGRAGLWASTQPGGIGLLELYRGDAFAAQLGPGSNRNTALRIYSQNENIVAAIGEDAQGHGAVRIGDSSGELAVSMAADEGGGVVQVMADASPVAAIAAENGSGVVAVYHERTPVAFLTRSSGGDGGNVTVAMNDGFGVFSAGAAQDGAGEACLQRRTMAGAERVACLGIALPSMGLGK